MRIQIGVLEDRGDAAVADLHRWFRRDDDLRGRVEIRLEPLPQPGAMGAVEIIELVLGQGFAALNLALSYAAWRAVRPTAPPVTITVDGVTVTVQDGSEESVRRIVAALRPVAPGEPVDRGADQPLARTGGSE
ncbi:hypothetical protein [Streptomyces sp. NPDC020965]|uniref:effector-associated constant component EACC1 n=1 Tax=Streptomyces sp. NPDC020965 TaxID=3365105 RepID=UPI0037941068